MIEPSIIGRLLMQTFGHSSAPARNAIGKFRIDEISVVDRPANEAKAFVKAASLPSVPEGFEKIGAVDGIQILKPAPVLGKGLAGPPIDELNQMAAEHAARYGCSFAKAMDTVVMTPRGSALYAATV